jgi:hypothetical protein
VITNSGMLYNDSSSTLTIGGPGRLTNNIGGTVVNAGTLTNNAGIDNAGTLNNTGTLNMEMAHWKNSWDQFHIRPLT